MKIEEISEYNFTGTSQYPLDEQNYVVAVKEDSAFSNKNIIPLYYITANCEVLAIDEEEIGSRTLVLSTQRDTVTEEIATRFCMNELFKIIRGPFIYNERHETDHNIPKKKIYKNYLQPLNLNELIEIFEAKIDVSKSRIYLHDRQLRDLINRKFVGTNQAFFTIFNSEIIGPFSLVGSDDEEFFLARINTEYKFGIYEINKEDIIELVANGTNRKIIYDKTILINSYKESFDFICDKDLLLWFDTELSNKKNTSLLNKSELNVLLEQIEKINSSIEIIESKERYDRILNILSNTKEIAISKQSLLNALPQFQVVQEELEALVKRRLDLKNDIDSRNQELDTIKVTLSDQQNYIEELNRKLIELKNQEQREQNKIRDTIKFDIETLERQKSQLGNEIETERERLSKTLDELKDNIKYQEKRKNELDTAINSLKKEFTSEQKDAQEKLSELVKQNTHFNFISGRDLPSDSEQTTSFESYTPTEDAITEYVNLRSQITDIFKNQYRHFETHFIDNLLISIHQNTLTLLAGLPGTGKTSLAKIITAALAPSSRTKEIPIAKGWTSQKDLIGFSNPLSKKFYQSQTGLYPLLKQLNFEWENETYLNSPMAYIILDEANLSPLEHYWSTFYNSTDSYANRNRALAINLGQSEVINYANTLRFIGTINYDQTTEELSPRILDRTNIIRLMPQQFQLENFGYNSINALNLSFGEIIKIFRLSDFSNEIQSVQMKDELMSKYEDIKLSFNKLNIYISPRVELGILRYCQVASKYMTEDMRPLDYCIAQRLLPLINLQGNKKAELEHLYKKVQAFNLDNSVSASILKNIIDIGSRSGYTQDNFNYFLTLTHV